MGRFEMGYGSTLDQRAKVRDIDQQWIRENENRELPYNDIYHEDFYDNMMDEREEIRRLLEAIKLDFKEIDFEDVKRELDERVNQLINTLKEKEKETGYKYSELINDVETFRTNALLVLRQKPEKKEFIEVQFTRFSETMKKRLNTTSKFIDSVIMVQKEHAKLHANYIDAMKEEVNLSNIQEVIKFFDKLCTDFQSIDFKNHQINHTAQFKKYVEVFRRFTDALFIVNNITEELDKIEKDNPELASKTVELRKELGNKLINLQQIDRDEYMSRINDIVNNLEVKYQVPQEEITKSTKDELIKEVIVAMLDAGELSSRDRDGNPDMIKKIEMINEAKKRLSMIDEDMLILLLNKYKKSIDEKIEAEYQNEVLSGRKM